jgi:hypothetical protein
VAVAVDEPSVVVLDHRYQVVEGELAAQASFSLRFGASSSEGVPSPGPLFAPYYERAKRTGESVEFVQFVDGRVVQVTVVPDEGRFVVSWRTLCILDVLTLDGLRTSLEEIVETLGSAEEELRRDAARSSLRVIEGGG